MSCRQVTVFQVDVDEMYESPTWDACYAVRSTETPFSVDIDLPPPATESAGGSDLIPEDPVDAEDKEDRLSTPSPVDQGSHAASWSSSQISGRTRSVTPTHLRARRARRAAASQPNRGQGYNRSRAPVSTGHGCVCCCCSQRRYSQGRSVTRRYRSRRYVSSSCMPSAALWEHLPVVIQPTRWYQVVGRMPCGYCKSQGRHKMTSWICQRCEVPLCLMPYRNCYTKWHAQIC
ncbi:uncharacterized protein LOC129350812 [Amphiprion ocellaris]|uniref:uncharacterized protein LOC129350812 n=1 Tax=Amphiprion ocellaris TaxID=80972 RepID=UPI002410BC3B|nr:uncharacterized protein LOC129350812 [Amphiprion ocellaris]